MNMSDYFAVYHVLKNGKHVFVPRTVTSNEKLAQSIAADFSQGRCIMPDGSERAIPARQCIAKAIATD